jgi:transcriptional regulator with XRE-family HTH domain
MSALSLDQFAVALKLHRDRLGISQPKAAKLCGVSSRVWWQWENAKGGTMAVTQEGVLRRLGSARPSDFAKSRKKALTANPLKAIVSSDNNPRLSGYSEKPLN